MSSLRRDPRRGQRGAALLIVVVIMAALLAAGGLAIYLQVADTRTTAYASSGRSALFCAEAGLAAARETAGEDYTSWQLILDTDPGNDPSWYPVRGDLDDPADGVPDFEVTIRDNDDEMPPATLDPTQDNDLKIFLVSTCLKYPDTPREVLEMVMYTAGGHNYRNQSGQGATNSGNAN